MKSGANLRDWPTRLQCAACSGSRFAVRHSSHLPILPICTDQSPSEDLWTRFEIGLCEACGLIQLLSLVPPEVLYADFHSEGQGTTWQTHYDRFAALILSYAPTSALEIGAGQGQMVERLKDRTKLTVLDPVYRGTAQGVTVEPGFLDEPTCVRLGRKWPMIISSHTLEHFHEFNQYFAGSRLLLEDGGLLLTAIPNLEFSFASGYANTLNPEHTAILTMAHVIALHERHGFHIERIDSFRDHTLYFVARAGKPAPMKTDGLSYSEVLVDRFIGRMNEKKKAIEHAVASDQMETWLFGASNLAQVLFSFGVPESSFAGLLDNSRLKHGKRLYGTSLRVEAPAALVGRKARIFVNAAAYNTEIVAQLKKLDPHWDVREI